MARYTGPKWKLSRRENVSLFDDDKWKKRVGSPGIHWVQRGRQSEYAEQFREKQKVKRMYGMLEKQFRRFFEMAGKAEGNTGLRLLQLLELRLDNVVYRLGLAKTRSAARQLVNHGHITVNGNKVDIPSYIVSMGDEISVSTKSQKKDFVKNNAEELKSAKQPKWVDKNGKFAGKVTREPLRDDMDQSIREQLIVELYSK